MNYSIFYSEILLNSLLLKWFLTISDSFILKNPAKGDLGNQRIVVGMGEIIVPENKVVVRKEQWLFQRFRLCF